MRRATAIRAARHLASVCGRSIVALLDSAREGRILPATLARPAPAGGLVAGPGHPPDRRPLLKCRPIASADLQWCGIPIAHGSSLHLELELWSALEQRSKPAIPAEGVSDLLPNRLLYSIHIVPLQRHRNSLSSAQLRPIGRRRFLSPSIEQSLL